MRASPCCIRMVKDYSSFVDRRNYFPVPFCVASVPTSVPPFALLNDKLKTVRVGTNAVVGKRTNKQESIPKLRNVEKIF